MQRTRAATEALFLMLDYAMDGAQVTIRSAR
jgi:hypothetical protein